MERYGTCLILPHISGDLRSFCVCGITLGIDLSTVDKPSEPKVVDPHHQCYMVLPRREDPDDEVRQHSLVVNALIWAKSCCITFLVMGPITFHMRTEKNKSNHSNAGGVNLVVLEIDRINKSRIRSSYPLATEFCTTQDVNDPL